MKSNEIIPVVISIIVIILVAVLQRYSKLFAAITATMPLTIPLSLWVVYSSVQGERTQVEEFAQSLVIGVIPTIAFTLALWVGARQGLKIAPLLILCYSVWGMVLLIVLGVRRWLGA
jgi:putative Mn2+ efflux pump MntP